MKIATTLVASLFAVSAFAQAPAKKDEKKPEAKPAVVAPAKDVKAADKSAAPAKKDDKKAEPAKK
jgi:hypothetical protein